jgi:hypothetical protein
MEKRTRGRRLAVEFDNACLFKDHHDVIGRPAFKVPLLGYIEGFRGAIHLAVIPNAYSAAACPAESQSRIR